MNKKYNELNKVKKKSSMHQHLTYLVALSLSAVLLGNNTTPLKAGTFIKTNQHHITDAAGKTISSKDYDIESLLLPRYLYILQDANTGDVRYNLFLKNAILSNESRFTVYVGSDYGYDLTGRWLYKQTDEFDMANPGVPFELQLSVEGTSGNIMHQTISVEIVDSSEETPVRLLPIGDSLTRAGIYLTEVMDSLENVQTVGTRIYPTESHPREGRGGWTLEKYFTSINSSDLDSPFVFPVGVEGKHYKGNTRDWQSICYTNSKHHNYEGFQKIARGWQDDGEYLYDENGYYKNPEIGDVMVDPTLPEGSQWVIWNGTSWTTMQEQPTAFEFSFPKYMERFAEAFPDGAPTHVSILLGTNDFGVKNGFENVEEYLMYYESAIKSIHDYDPSIKVIVCIPPLGPNEHLIDDYTGRYRRFDRNTKLAAYYLLKTFDHDEAVKENIYIAPMHLNLDTTNGFDYKLVEQEIDGQKQLIRTPKNSIHPNNTVGQIQMGETLAAVIQKYRS